AAVDAFFAVNAVVVTGGKTCAFGRDQIKKELEPYAVLGDSTVFDESYEATSDHIVYRASFSSKAMSTGAEFG
ncbi:hypothetical protein PENTCL1PPCAC_24072, partial [Pristionchus entomophagus]